MLAVVSKVLDLNEFKGENVNEHCTKANELLVQLEKDNCLPETQLVDILDHLSVCSAMEFKVPWLGHRKEIEANPPPHWKVTDLLDRPA